MPSKCVRSLIGAGPALLVTIPKGWIDFYGLKKGDKVEVVVNGDVRISPMKETEKAA